MKKVLISFIILMLTLFISGCFVLVPMSSYHYGYYNHSYHHGYYGGHYRR
jgi:hypothetical protein